MKRFALLFLLLSFAGSAFAVQTVKLGEGTNSLSVISSTATETILEYSISSFEREDVMIEGQTWQHITLPDEGITQDQGFPQLPVFNRSIIIGDTALMKLEVYDVVYQELELPVAPSKGVITRDIDPSTVPYTFDRAYQTDAFYPDMLAELSEPYILRDFRGITIRTTPFAYNPPTRTLRVFTSFKIRVFAQGTDNLNVLTGFRESISRDFAPLYSNHFVNWNQYRYTPVNDAFGKLIVICHTNYLSAILPYVNWKKQKGIETELVEWSTIGTTAAQLQTYIQNRYNADNTVAYVQIVGDAPQIPTLSSGGGGSDPSFSLVAGADNYPDIFIGRFSAETAAQVETQINKAIAYERDLNTSATWLSQAMGIASAEGGGSQGDNGESDIAHMNLIRTDLLGYGYTAVDQIYDPGASAATVTTNVNDGRGFINYVGHGADTYWVTTGFSNTNAFALTNGSKTPFIMDVACVNGNFVSITCFAEAWLRNANGGAVAMYASTINQSWNSPMRAQDEVTDLLTAEAKFTTGGLYYNGSCKMMDIYGSTTGSDGVNMFKTWHIFGDASLVARTKTPIAMTVTHPATIVSGTTSVSVSTGVPNTLVAITHNNTIYGRGLTNSLGNLTMTLLNPPTGVLSYTITATAHNRVTYVGSIAQTVANGPWMEVLAASYDDANNDLPDYEENGYFDVTFKNSGTALASDVSAILSCATPGITITDASHAISSLAAGSTTIEDNAYALSIADNLANGSLAEFTITMSMSGFDPWVYNFSKLINAPALAFGNMSVSDPSGDNDGLLDPGETATVSIVLNNNGGAASLAGSGTMNCSTTGITIVNGSAGFTAISAGGSATLSFTVTAASSMVEGTLAAFTFNASAGQYSAATTVNVEVGAPLEVVIGNGSSSQSYPIDRYYNYSSHEAIYLAGEIGIPGAIKSIAFQKASGADVNPIDAVTIYMKNTSASSLATGTYSTSGYTQVYSGAWPNTATSGWMEVNLQNQFAYDGSNLSILTVKGNQAYIYDYPNWTYTSATANRARQAHSDTAQPTSLTATTNLPNLKLKLFPTAGVLLPPQNLSALAGNGYVSLTWQAPFTGSPTAYRIYRDGSLLASVAGLSYTDSAVVNETTYSYYLTAVYESGVSDPSNPVTAMPTAVVVTQVVLGSGTSSNGTSTACPINIYYESLHGQSVYTAAELNAAGINGPVDITQIGFYVSSAPAVALPNFVVRMKHTSASNVASWQTAAGMVTVYNAASYMPVAGGFDMLTLATPFTWNGTDNIVIDTAFSPLTPWSSSGTTQYTTVTDGYRYIRADDVDQTNVFSGGYTSTNRPNVRLVLQPGQSDGPVIAVSPASLAFGSVAVGSVSTLLITVQNTGNALLSGSVATPAGFSVAPNRAGYEFALADQSPASRNTLSFSVGAGSSQIFDLSFSPASATNYSGNVVISTNAINSPVVNVPVSGAGLDLPANPRFVAEWEPALGAIVRYPLGLPYSLLADLSNHGLLYVVVATSSQSTCNSALTSNGVNMANVRYINATTDSYWVRDYGPWTIFDGSEMKIVDFTYNRPRPNDDIIPVTVANYLGLDYYTMPLTATGGNVMADGHEAMMSTELILEENSSLTQAQIDALALNYLGVTDYQFYTDPNNTYIDHIDCWAKLLDVDKVLIRSVPTSHAQYSAIEATVDEWEAKTSGYGTPYQIFRVNTPNDEPYTNSFILNKRVYVPLMASANDAAALAAYQAAMPGYAVTGYTHSTWESTDALHCRVNTVFDAQMIHVWHVPPTSATANSSLAITAEITHANPLQPAATHVAFRHGSTGEWQYAPLTHVSANDWTAQVPTPALGQTLYYYVLATDTTARTASLPLCGADDPFEVLVNIPGSNNAPTISLPDSFSYDQNGSLTVDFSPYVADLDGDDLTLSYSDNTNVLVSIGGLNVTLSAVQDWFGTETLTFTVSDGTDTATENVSVSVNLNYLAVPQLTALNPSAGLVRLEWSAIPNALSYEVWACDEPFGTFTYLGSTAALYWEDSANQAMRFYKVIASNEPMAK